MNIDTEEIQIKSSHSEKGLYEWQIELKKDHDVLTLVVWRESNSEFNGHVTLTPFPEWDLDYSEIRLSTNEISGDSLKAIFMALKSVLKIRDGIDDLVQLNGYYQQSQNFIKINLRYPETTKCQYWSTASKFSSSNLIGKTASVSKWSNNLGVSNKELPNIFSSMKTIGYDIRNSVTNPQIADGHYLVTYRFPTLTKKSVQTFKKLNPPSA